jgi:hypothetical protein
MSEVQKYGYLNQPYIPELEKLATGKPGQIQHIMVEHADWCPLLAGTGLCVCRPIVRKPNRHERRKLKKQYGSAAK